MPFLDASLLMNPANFLAAETGEIGWMIFAYYVPVFLVIAWFIWAARKGITKGVWNGPVAQAAEHLYIFLDGMAVNVIGGYGRKYVPFLMTMWLLIFVSNLFGLVLDYTPTADWSLNLGLAIIVIFYVQYEGVKQNGIFGHLGHFAGPKLSGALVLVSGLLFVVEITSECLKLLSLSLRLYGNIHGGHIVVSSLNQLVQFGPADHPFFIPLGAILFPLKFFTCLIQAYVFVMLSCTYLSLVTHDPETHHHDEDHGAVEAHPVAA